MRGRHKKVEGHKKDEGHCHNRIKLNKQPNFFNTPESFSVVLIIKGNRKNEFNFFTQELGIFHRCISKMLSLMKVTIRRKKCLILIQQPF